MDVVTPITALTLLVLVEGFGHYGTKPLRVGGLHLFVHAFCENRIYRQSKYRYFSFCTILFSLELAISVFNIKNLDHLLTFFIFCSAHHPVWNQSCPSYHYSGDNYAWTS